MVFRFDNSTMGQFHMHGHPHDRMPSALQTSFVRCSPNSFGQTHQQLAEQRKNIFAIRCSTTSVPAGEAAGSVGA